MRAHTGAKPSSQKKCQSCGGQMVAKDRYWQCKKCKAQEREEQDNSEKAFMKCSYDRFYW